MGRSSSVEEIAIAMQTTGRERRKLQRFECEGGAEVVVLESGCHYQGEVKDVSLGGCYILAPAEWKLDRCSGVELWLEVNGDHFSTPARVILVRAQSGAAFEFLPVEPEMRSAHLALLQRLTASLALPVAKQAS